MLPINFPVPPDLDPGPISDTQLSRSSDTPETYVVQESSPCSPFLFLYSKITNSSVEACVSSITAFSQAVLFCGDSKE